LLLGGSRACTGRRLAVGLYGDGDDAAAAWQRAGPGSRRSTTCCWPRHGICRSRELNAWRPELRSLLLSMRDSEEHLLQALRSGASG
jgi:hypothetical protein